MSEIVDMTKVAAVPPTPGPDLREVLAERHRHCLTALARLDALSGSGAHPADVGSPAGPDLPVELDRATREVLSELGAAALAVMDSLAATPRGGSIAGFLSARLHRLDLVAKDVLAAAKGNDGATLQRALQQFHALASAMWQVQLGVQGRDRRVGEMPAPRTSPERASGEPATPYRTPTG